MEQPSTPSHIKTRRFLDPESHPWRIRILWITVMLVYALLTPLHKLEPNGAAQVSWFKAIMPEIPTLLIGGFCLFSALALWDLFLNLAKLVRHGGSYWRSHGKLFIFDAVVFIMLYFLYGAKFKG